MLVAVVDGKPTVSGGAPSSEARNGASAVCCRNSAAPSPSMIRTQIRSASGSRKASGSRLASADVGSNGRPIECRAAGSRSDADRLP
jgi:hypothetical protein